MMKFVNESAAVSTPVVEVTQMPSAYIWRDQGREIFLCNPEVVQGTDDNDPMMLRYLVIIEGQAVNFRVWRELGFNSPLWYATDVTGALNARGSTPAEAMMRIML